MDKIVLKFFADVMYVKGYIYYSEFEAIMNSCTPQDLDDIVERMLKDEYKGYTRGEGYVTAGIKL